MKNGIRRVLLALALLAFLVPAPLALAGSLSGEGEVSEKNMQLSTVTIGSESYSVSEKTVIRNENGQRISLRRLPVPSAGREGDPVHASYEAVESRGQRVLLSLQVAQTPQ